MSRPSKYPSLTSVRHHHPTPLACGSENLHKIQELFRLPQLGYNREANGKKAVVSVSECWKSYSKGDSIINTKVSMEELKYTAAGRVLS